MSRTAAQEEELARLLDTQREASRKGGA